MKKVLRRATCAPVEQTDPPQFFSIEWWEVDIDFEMRRAERRRLFILALSVISVIFGTVALLSVMLRCLAS